MFFRFENKNINMKQPQTLFSLSVKKYLHAILQSCCHWVLWSNGEKLRLSIPQTKDISHKLLFHADYSMNEAYLEIESFCSEHNFIDVQSILCVCFPSMKYLPQTLAKILWVAYVKLDFELHFIHSFLTNDFNVSIERLDNHFLSKFTHSPKIESVLQYTRKQLLFANECLEMLDRFSEYYENDLQDGPESDSESEFDEFPPPPLRGLWKFSQY